MFRREDDAEDQLIVFFTEETSVGVKPIRQYGGQCFIMFTVDFELENLVQVRASHVRQGNRARAGRDSKSHHAGGRQG